MIEDNISNAIGQSMFNKDFERSYIDKLLAKEDIKSVRDILKKEILGRSDILEVNDFIVSVESKLLNLEPRERYVLNKYYIWVQYFMSVSEQLFDYEAKITTKFKQTSSEKNRLLEYIDLTKKSVSNTLKMMFNVYLLIARTSLSKTGKTIDSLSSNKFDINYQMPLSNLNPQQNSNMYGLGGSK